MKNESLSLSLSLPPLLPPRTSIETSSFSSSSRRTGGWRFDSHVLLPPPLILYSLPLSLDEASRPFLPSGSFNRSQVGNPIARSRSLVTTVSRRCDRACPTRVIHQRGVIRERLHGAFLRGRSSARTHIERAERGRERERERERLLIGNRTRRKHAVRPEKIKLKRDYTKLGTPR